MDIWRDEECSFEAFSNVERRRHILVGASKNHAWRMPANLLGARLLQQRYVLAISSLLYNVIFHK